MVCVILAWNESAKKEALKSGFKEQVVLVRFDCQASTEGEKRKLEKGIEAFHPYQYLVSDYWGMEPD